MPMISGRFAGTYAEERLLNIITGDILLTESFSSPLAWRTPGVNDPETGWTLGTGPSPTTTTGTSGGADPVTRAPIGGNPYRFTEADQAGPWSLESPRFDASKGTLTLTFDVHMRFGSLGGIADGTLRVQGWDGADWSNIGAAIVGSQQSTANDLYKPSFAFGSYTSAGFANDDFKFRFLFTKGASTFTVNYDAAVDNLVVRGPIDAGPLDDEDGGPGETPGAGPFPKPLFGTAFAPWAIPASLLPTHPNSNNIKNQLFAITPARFNLQSNFFCPAVYNLADANTTVTLFGRPNLINSNIAAGTQIPWNVNKFICPENFNPGDTDSYVLLINFNTGECFEFFETRFIPPNRLECLVALKIKQGVDNTGSPDGNVLLKDNAFRVSRACGIQHAVGLIMRAEVDKGVIPHCTTMLWQNPTQFAHEAPAIKGAGGTGGGPNRAFMGLRLVWDGLTDSDINNWLATRPARSRPVLKMVADCLRNYGSIGTDHGGNAALQRGGIQMEHNLSANWESIGFFDSETRTALFDLMEPNRAKSRVVVFPTHVGNNDNNVACYDGVPYPAGHPCA